MENFKIEILKTLYLQQQSTAHILRARISKISTGAIALLVVMDGWIITNKATLPNSNKTMLMAAVIVIVGIAIYAIYARYKEFSAVATLIVRIETAMKIYEKGVYLEKESLYLDDHKDFGKKSYEHGKNIFLPEVYILTIFGILSVCIALFA